MIEPKKKLNKKKRRKGNDQEILGTSKMLKNWHHGYEKNTVRALTERYNNAFSALTLSQPSSKLSGPLWWRGERRKESLQLRLGNLNICIGKVDAKC